MGHRARHYGRNADVGREGPGPWCTKNERPSSLTSRRTGPVRCSTAEGPEVRAVRCEIMAPGLIDSYCYNNQ